MKFLKYTEYLNVQGWKIILMFSSHFWFFTINFFKKYTNVIKELCKSSQMDYFRKNFTNWTSENKKIDNLIQEIQLKSIWKSDIIFEWISFDQVKWYSKNK